MTRFGDLIGGNETVVTPITTPQPVVKKPVKVEKVSEFPQIYTCLLYTSPSPRDVEESRMPSSA